MNTFALKFLFIASKGGGARCALRGLVCSDAVDRIPDDRIPETVKRRKPRVRVSLLLRYPVSGIRSHDHVEEVRD